MPRAEVQSTADSLRAAFGDATFTTGAAEAAGIPRHRLHSATRAGVVVRLRQGTYRMPCEPHQSSSGGPVPTISAGPPSRKGAGAAGAADARAALTLEEELRVRDRLDRLHRMDVPACIGERTAARVAGVDEWGVAQERYPIIVVPRGSARRGSRGGITVVEQNIDPRHLTLTTGSDPLPMVDPLHASLQVAARPRLSMAARVAVLSSGMRRQVALSERLAGPSADVMLSRYVADPRMCGALLLQAHNRAANIDVQHRRTLIDAVARADPRLETVLEAISWNQFIDAGFERPLPQVQITGASDRRWRVDFLFGDRVIGECDGALKYSEPNSLWREKKRQEDLEQAGYIVVRWTWEEILYRPWEVIQRIRNAIKRAAALAG